jgi:uncharacterized membrane protein (UPF0127 family)
MDGSRDKGLRWLVWAAWVVLVAAVAVFLIRGADRTVRPKLRPNGGAVASKVQGFEQIAFEVHPPGGYPQATDVKRCALLARTTAQQDQGLMNRRDLAGYDAMVFQFDRPTTTEFYMKDTLIDLSIAWFDASGKLVSTAEMVPCPPAAVCPLYGATGPYTIAIEVPRGGLSTLGIEAGASVSIGGTC